MSDALSRESLRSDTYGKWGHIWHWMPALDAQEGAEPLCRGIALPQGGILAGDGKTYSSWMVHIRIISSPNLLLNGSAEVQLMVAVRGNRRLFVHRVLASMGVISTMRVHLHTLDDPMMLRLRWDDGLGRDATKLERSLSLPSCGTILLNLPSFIWQHIIQFAFIWHHIIQLSPFEARLSLLASTVNA